MTSYLTGDRVLEINARRMDGLSRTDAIEWFKVCDKATLVLERFVEAPTTTTSNQQQMQQPTSQSQLSSFEGVSSLSLSLSLSSNFFHSFGCSISCFFLSVKNIVFYIIPKFLFHFFYIFRIVFQWSYNEKENRLVFA